MKTSDRRGFLKGLAGGFVATAALPVLADDAGAFPYRGAWERLSLAYQRIHLGLETPFSVLHISDTHLTEADDDEGAKVDFARQRRNTFGGRQEEALRDSLAWARKSVDLANLKFWKGVDSRFRSAALPDPAGDLKRQLESPVTTDFIAYLRSEKLLRGILSGHLHITTQERFSPTAVQYVVGGNFLFHGEEILFT